MKAWAQKQRGFTIVELLIVVVVIAILAAITIVSYNGITQQAENTKTVNGVSQYARLVQSYAVKTGLYPVASYACLGPSGTRCANTTDSTAACFGAASASAQLAFETAMKTLVNAMPEVSSQAPACNGKTYSGAWYHSVDGRSTTLVYYLRGDQECVATGGLRVTSKNQRDDTTSCYTSFPAL